MCCNPWNTRWLKCIFAISTCEYNAIYSCISGMEAWMQEEIGLSLGYMFMDILSTAKVWLIIVKTIFCVQKVKVFGWHCLPSAKLSWNVEQSIHFVILLYMHWFLGLICCSISRRIVEDERNYHGIYSRMARLLCYWLEVYRKPFMTQISLGQ